MKPARPVQLWAIIIRNPRAEWIYYPSCKRTRREAIDAYLDGYSERSAAALKLRRDRRNKDLRLARVTVTLDPTP